MGTEKIIERREQKIVTGWGVKIYSFREGDYFKGQGGVRTVELSKK